MRIIFWQPLYQHIDITTSIAFFGNRFVAILINDVKLVIENKRLIALSYLCHPTRKNQLDSLNGHLMNDATIIVHFRCRLNYLISIEYPHSKPLSYILSYEVFLWI